MVDLKKFIPWSKDMEHAKASAVQLSSVSRTDSTDDQGYDYDDSVLLIDVGRVIVHDQIRKKIKAEELAELTKSIKEVGQLQPCVAYPSSEQPGFYVLIAGHRRFNAVKEAGISTLRCSVLGHYPSDEEVLEIQLTENVQREDLPMVDEAEAYGKFRELGYSQEKIAKRTGKSQSTVSRALNLLALDPKVLDRLRTFKSPARKLATQLTKTKEVDEQLKLIDEYKRGESKIADSSAKPSKQSIKKKVRTQKVNGIDFQASGKQKTTSTDIALGYVVAAERTSLDGKSKVDLEKIIAQCDQTAETLRRALTTKKAA